MNDLMQTSRRAWAVLSFLALTAIATVVFLGKPYESSLQALDSTTHAMLALEVTSSGGAPVLPMTALVTNKKTDSVFNDHPFTLFYLSGKFMRWFGPEAWTARFVPGVFSIGCVVLLAILGSLMYSPAVGLIAGLILTLSRDFILIGSRFHLDTAMVFFILLSFLFYWRRQYVWMGLAAGLGMWMKTPVALLVYPSAVLALILTREFKWATFRTLFLSGLLALVVGSLVWIYTGIQGGWELSVDYWVRQVYGTAVQGRGTPHPHERWMGIETLRRGYYPWLILLLASVVQIFYRKRWRSPAVALAISAVLVLEAVLACVQFKFFWYFIPVYPFLALVGVDVLRDWLQRYETRVMAAMIGVGIFIPTLLVATPIELGPENFPALRRFEPIIQQYGSCSDRVMFLDGDQPFGGELDNMYELGFYTGRKILQANCDDAKTVIQAHQPEWIVLTEKTKVCLSEETSGQYPVQYQFGRQYLWSRIIPKQKALDLTPLERELKPVRDGCKVVPYPKNIYFPHE